MWEEISFRWENDLDSFLLFSIIEFNDLLIIILTLNSKSVVQDILSIYAFVKISFQNDMKKFKKNLWLWETTSRVNSQRSLKKLFTWNDIRIIDTRVYMVNFEIRELCNRVEKFTIFNYNETINSSRFSSRFPGYSWNTFTLLNYEPTMLEITIKMITFRKTLACFPFV